MVYGIYRHLPYSILCKSYSLLDSSKKLWLITRYWRLLGWYYRHRLPLPDRTLRSIKRTDRAEWIKLCGFPRVPWEFWTMRKPYCHLVWSQF